ncbi:MAG TPA: NAD(P)-dependent oxidoreductase [Myxococcales bacterium]|nr:NAD(P)-dependent oxidoreductase [Myxococcales bacterium]
MSTIGFVGLGAMGSRMAGRFLESGQKVYGSNRTAAKATALIERGLSWCESPVDVARSAEVIFTMVTDDTALAAIASGQQGILAGLSPGKIWVDMSTVSPEAASKLAGRVERLGAALLNAPVSGSVPSAEQGTLEIMVGGDPRAFERAEPLLRELGQRVIFVGRNDQALILKLAININLAEQMLAFSEGVLLAERSGIDRKLAAEVITASAVGSPMLKARMPLVLDLPQSAWFNLRLVQKDLRLALRAADALHVPVPGAAVADETVTMARRLGYGERDLAALFEALARIGAEQPVSTAATSGANPEP